MVTLAYSDTFLPSQHCQCKREGLQFLLDGNGRQSLDEGDGKRDSRGDGERGAPYSEGRSRARS